MVMTMEPIQRRREATSGRRREPDVSGMADAFLECRELGHAWSRPTFGLAEPVTVSAC